MSRSALDREGRELWARLRKTVRPLHPGSGQSASDEAEGAHLRADPAKPASAAPPRPAMQPSQPSLPPLVRLNARSRRRIERGLVELDARIDLHGMNQERAHSALLAFLRAAQARGHRTVLVITGKGRADASGRGVLRQSVPDWLSRADLRTVILGIEEAGRKHGGAGALYVQLRRRNR